MIHLFIILCLWHQTHDGEAAEDKARGARILCAIRWQAVKPLPYQFTFI